MAAQENAVASRPVADWFAVRSFDHERFSDLGRLAAAKRELDLTVSVVLPCREVAGTIGAIGDEIQSLNQDAPLVDEVVAVDARSADGTADVARRQGFHVYDEEELLPRFGPVAGKGDAMWRALSVVRGDLVLFLDSDTVNFGRHFISGMLGPILTEPGVRFVKATYHRPRVGPDGAVIEDAGRVTELMAKPLISVFHRELVGFGQPLAGEFAAHRELFASLPFWTGYGVDIGLLIDVHRAAGLDAMAQVHLGTRRQRSQALRALGAMSYAVARPIVERAIRLPATADLDSFLRAVCDPEGTHLEEQRVELFERPPMNDVFRP
jgi:glucosyl-3-phosphoglycerate synthase